MIAVSMNTRPSIIVVLTSPLASGCLAILSVDLAEVKPIPIAPPAAARPTQIPAAIPLAPIALSVAASVPGLPHAVLRFRQP